MFAQFLIAGASVVATNPAADDYDKTHINTVATLEGQYLPLVTKALAYPKMRGRRLDCYTVRVRRWTGTWRVYFAGHRAPRPPDTETEIHVGHTPQNVLCPDIGFAFDAKGRINQVILSRE